MTHEDEEKESALKDDNNTQDEEDEVVVKSGDNNNDSSKENLVVIGDIQETPNKSVVVDDNRDKYSLILKPEYVLQSRATTLPDLPEESNNNNNDRGNNNGNKSKKRPRDVKVDSSTKLCLSVIRNTTCQYGNKCKFMHDIKEYMATRPDDIQAEHCPKICPIFELTGYCEYGPRCRFGSSHLNMATGENITTVEKSNEKSETTTSTNTVLNHLPKDLQIQLRKKKYPFICQQHKDKKKQNNNNNNNNNNGMNGNNNKDEEKVSQQEEKKNGTEDSNKTDEETKVDKFNLSEVAEPINLNPLPSKERKIIDFTNKVYIAPLTTVGNLPFRRIMKKYGADITCGEMAIATNILAGQPSEWALLKRHIDEDIFGIQLAAGYADVFTRTMEIVEKYIDVDFVDLNLGCPLDLVCKKGSGAALMMRDNRLKQSLFGITTTLQKCPVTIKMRTGWDEKKPFAHELIRKIQSWNYPGIGAIMMHGRSRLQRYSKEADWEYINQSAIGQDNSIDKIPIIGNGDIMSYADYEKKVLQNDGILNCAMLGRGALIKPWLPTEIKEQKQWDISATERLDILKDFVKFGLEHWGTDQQGVNNCRRFLLEWLSFLHRYIPIGILEQTNLPQQMNQRPPKYMCGRNDLETLFLSDHCNDWIKISEMLLGPVPDNFRFEPKHKANSYAKE